MKFTYNWLREFIDTDFSPDEIAAKLPMLGFEVESIYSLVPSLDGIVVGKVLNCKPHEDSQYLKQCEIDVGREILNITCGAPNIAEQQLVAVAPPESSLPGGLKIERKSILGVDSYGMICSEKELGLSDDADGVLIFDDSVRPGKNVHDVIEPDWVIDIDVTPNRPDAMGVIGIAREISLLTSSSLKYPEINLQESSTDIASLINVEIRDAHGCPRYATKIIKNIDLKKSPAWMRRRLNAIGVRTKSNIVDVTNYVMMETGQPLHAFDYDLIEKKKILVRKAQQGEVFQTLDEKEYKLRKDDIVICDAEKPIALAGIMGGLNSEVSEKTRNVLIESAYFDPVQIRLTAKYCGISSDASKRFERGMDSNGVPYTLKRAAQLMQLTSCGEVVSGTADVYPKVIIPVEIQFRPKRVVKVLGSEITSLEMEKILTGLECEVIQKTNEWGITVPTFRPDLTREIDLIEEIARVNGYDNIPENLRSSFNLHSEKNKHEDVTENVRQIMIGLGFDEAVTWNFVSQEHAVGYLSENQTVLPLMNALTADLAFMRPSILSSLLGSVTYNINRKNGNVWLYEIGSTFWKNRKDKICEEPHIGAIAFGGIGIQDWTGKKRTIGLYDIRGFVESLTGKILIPEVKFKPLMNHKYYEMGWELGVNGVNLGTAGKLSSAALNLFNIDVEVYSFEMNLLKLKLVIEPNRKYKKMSKFPAVERDLAIVVDRQIPAEEISFIIRSVGGSFLEDIELFDLYTGKQVAVDKKSMAFSLRFRAQDRTLTDKEVETWQSDILKQLSKEYGAELRS